MSVVEDLRQIGFQPSKGQNFLKSEPVIQALVESGEVEGKNVLEMVLVLVL